MRAVVGASTAAPPPAGGEAMPRRRAGWTKRAPRSGSSLVQGRGQENKYPPTFVFFYECLVASRTPPFPSNLQQCSSNAATWTLTRGWGPCAAESTARRTCRASGLRSSCGQRSLASLAPLRAQRRSLRAAAPWCWCQSSSTATWRPARRYSTRPRTLRAAMRTRRTRRWPPTTQTLPPALRGAWPARTPMAQWARRAFA